jgi:hypothetical protein
MDKDKKFKVGDDVICRESHLGENSLWVKVMDATVGKKLAVLEGTSNSGNLWCRCEETGDCFWYMPEWLEPYLYKKKRVKPKEFKVGDLVVCKEKHCSDILWGGRCDPLVGKPMTVVKVNGTEFVECVPKGNPLCERTTVWKTEWLEAYTEFKVGDIVICRKSHEDDGRLFWSERMNEALGIPLVVFEIKDNGNLKCSNDINGIWTYLPDWLEYYTEKGNEEMKKDGNNVAPVVVDENVYYGIKEIISNPAKRATTVIFNDGKIVCVKAGVDVEKPDIYSAVTAAIGIHFAGSNNALKNIISKKTTELKPKRKGTRKEFTIEAGDLVKLTRKAQKDAVYPARTTDGEPHPLLSVRIEKDADREMLVTEVVKEDDKTVAYVNVPEKLKDFEYKIPVEFLRITRKGR